MGQAIMLSLDSRTIFNLLTKEVVAVLQRSAPKKSCPIDTFLFCKRGGEPLVAYKQRSWLVKERNKFSFTCGKLDDKVVDTILKGEACLLNNRVNFTYTLISTHKVDPSKHWSEALKRNTGYSREEAIEYSKGKPIYLWYLSLDSMHPINEELHNFAVNDYAYKKEMLYAHGCDAKNCLYERANSVLGDDGYCDMDRCPKLAFQHAPKGWGYVTLV